MLLGIDVGTSACKAFLYEPGMTSRGVGDGICGRIGESISGRIGEYAADCVTDCVTESYPIYYPKPGWVEQDPEDWFTGVCAAIRALLTVYSASDIQAVGVAGQSWAAAAVDAKGRAIAMTPTWMDTRAAKICEETIRRLGEDRLFNVCANAFAPGYSAPKVLWYKEHMPDVFYGARYFLQSNAYIVARLTGRFTQDKSQGYGYACYDVVNGCWDDALCDELGIPREKLPPVVDSHAVVGEITREAAELCGLRAGTPVVAGGLDAACGTLGAGVIHPGQTQEQGGQAGGMSICVGKPVMDKRLILSSHVVPGTWLLQGGTVAGGGAMRWFHETLGGGDTLEALNEAAKVIPAGSEGVCFLPYLAGERSPIWDPYARGVYYGLTFGSTKGHMTRALMEGCAYALRQNLETANQPISAMRTVGGSSKSRLWTQIKADVTGHVIEVPDVREATAKGAAILAGVGAGVFKSFEEAVSDITISRTHVPDGSLGGVYNNGYKLYRRLYENLKETMREEGNS